MCKLDKHNRNKGLGDRCGAAGFDDHRMTCRVGLERSKDHTLGQAPAITGESGLGTSSAQKDDDNDYMNKVGPIGIMCIYSGMEVGRSAKGMKAPILTCKHA